MKDPVCDKELDLKAIPYTSVYDSRVYSFCSLVCKTEFDRNPVKYATQKSSGEYCYSCGYGKRYGRQAFYLWIGIIALLVMVLLLSLWFRR